jgi:hypothetical protein
MNLENNERNYNFDYTSYKEYMEPKTLQLSRAQTMILHYLLTQFHDAKYKKIKSSRITIIDFIGNSRTFCCNVYGDIIDAHTRKIIAVSNIPHVASHRNEMPTAWTNQPAWFDIFVNIFHFDPKSEPMYVKEHVDKLAELAYRKHSAMHKCWEHGGFRRYSFDGTYIWIEYADRRSYRYRWANDGMMLWYQE